MLNLLHIDRMVMKILAILEKYLNQLYYEKIIFTFFICSFF